MPLASEPSANCKVLPEPKAAIVVNEASSSQLVFCCDHAGSEIPRRLGDLDVPEVDRNDHIGLDIGIFATTCWIAGTLKAPVVAQPISRLVIDCNRKPDSTDSIRQTYDGRTIPGNADLNDAERDRRASEILMPYQNALADTLAKAGRGIEGSPILVAMHSFTRSHGSEQRACDIGVIFEGRQEFAADLLKNLSELTDLRVMHNEPYRVDFRGDYTIPHHTFTTGIPYVEIEVCQDLISTCQGQRDIARLLLAAIELTLEPILAAVPT